jgi:hypothetical protein
VKQYFVGIDPGKNGAVGVVDKDGRFVAVHDCPDTDDGFVTIINEYRKPPTGDNIIFIRMCTLEKIQAMPKQGVTSCVNFGKNKGVWRGILAALAIPRQFVTSREWQKVKGPMPKAKSKKDKKQQSRQVAKELWPECPVTLVKHSDRAEALLIAEYGRRKFLGLL